jgi:hypothetical protein
MKSVIGAGVVACALTAAASAQESLVVDVSGIESFNTLGSVENTVLTFELLPNATVVGLEWDVVLQANGGSWLNEMSIAFGSTAEDFVFFAPSGTNSPGGNLPEANSGSANLVDLGLAFDVAGDGILRMEFYESFYDTGVVPNGVWVSGTITVQYVPAPAGLALLGAAGLAGNRRRRG